MKNLVTNYVYFFSLVAVVIFRVGKTLKIPFLSLSLLPNPTEMLAKFLVVFS